MRSQPGHDHFGGVNIYSAEIEAELSRMPGVADCAVLDIPEDELCEKVCAIIQPHPGVAHEADDVREFLKGKLAKYKVPRHIEFRTEVPRQIPAKSSNANCRTLLGAFGTSNMTSDALHHAAVDANGGAVDHGSALAAEEHDHVRDFLGLREPLIDRAGALVLDEVLRGLID